MNDKTAKLLRRVARRRQVTQLASRPRRRADPPTRPRDPMPRLIAEWHATPRPDRAALRRRLRLEASRGRP